MNEMTALENTVAAVEMPTKRHDPKDLAPAIIGTLIGLGAAYLVHKYREGQEKEKEAK